MPTKEIIKPEQFALLLNDYKRKPSTFIKEVLGCNIWEMQSNIIDAIFEYSQVAVKTCNATGKTYIAARIAVAYLFLHPNSIVVTTAPTWKQVTNALWREIATAVKMSKFKLTDQQVTQAGLNLGTKWYAIGVSTSTPDNMMGFHADNLLVIVDEAGGVNDLMFRGVKAITTNIHNKVLLIGNPTVAGGEFWRAFEPSSMYYQMTISAFDTPNMLENGIDNVETLMEIFTPPSGVDKLQHFKQVRNSLKLPYPELIDPGTVYQRAIEWGTDSNGWQALIMGEFPSQAEQSLFPADLVYMAMQMNGVDDATGKTYAELSGWDIPTGAFELGVDMARYGGDSTVATPRRGGWVDKQVVWNKTDLMTSADKILQLFDPLDFNARVDLDDTGNGGGTTDRLVQIKNQTMLSGDPAHQYQIAAYNFSSKEMMSNPDKFHDITAELYWNLRTQFHNKKIALHYDEQLYNELISRRWRINPSSGKIQVESKDDYKKRTGGKSPDRSDSLALAFAGGIRKVRLYTPDQNEFDDNEATLKPMTSGLNRGW